MISENEVRYSKGPLHIRKNGPQIRISMFFFIVIIIFNIHLSKFVERAIVKIRKLGGYQYDTRRNEKV